MTKFMAILIKKPGMSSEEFRRYWKETHGPIAAKMPGLRKYVQDHSLSDTSGNAPAFDGVAELWFDSPEAMQASWASPAGQATIADVPNFLDPQATRMLVVDEQPVVG